MLRIGMSFLPFLFRFPAPTCSAGCDQDLPEVNFNDCTPQVNYSEICRLIVGKKDTTAFTDWTTATEWLARISQSSTSNSALRALTVIADKPAATPVTKDISNGRTFIIGKDHLINYTIDDVSDENYNFMRQLECGMEVTFWYETQGEKMFGGNGGVVGRMVANNVLGRGKDEIEVISGTIAWRDKFHPERTDSPIFGTGNDNAGNFDTELIFSSTLSDADAGVSATANATDPDSKFEFNEITPRIGSPASMTIHKGSADVLVVDYPTDYNGKPWKYTDAQAVVHTGTFTNGTITIS